MSTEEKIIKNKVGLLDLSNHPGNVSRACKIFGYYLDYYDDLVFGLGNKFVLEIEHIINRIRENPSAFPFGFRIDTYKKWIYL